jgi:micrococcal nuclease
MDTPETKAPNTPVEFMGPQAAAANAGLVDGKTVHLERDVSETDSFGRLLRYVWLDRGEQGWLLVNLRLVERGFAQAATFPPDVRYQELFVTAQRTARGNETGLWAPTEAPAAKATRAPAAKPAASAKPKPTRLPVVEVYYANCTEARAAGAAPMHKGDPGYREEMDRDRDGIACE